MKFPLKNDFEIYPENHFVFFHNTPTQGLNDLNDLNTLNKLPELNFDIPENETEKAKDAIRTQLESMKNAAKEPKNWKIDKQLQFLSKLSKHESTLDNDETSDGFMSIFSNDETPELSEIVTQFSDEALLAFVTTHKKETLELFTETEGIEKTVNFFGINFLERNISALELLETEDQYLCIGRLQKTYYVRQSDGYLQVEPKTDKKKYARIGSTTKFKILSKEKFEEAVPDFQPENFELPETIEANEKNRIQNFNFYQKMKLSAYHLRDEHPELVNADKLKEFLEKTLDAFYKTNKCINPQEFNLKCNGLINENVKDLLGEKSSIDEFKGFFDDYLEKTEENDKRMLEYNRTQILEYLKSVDPKVRIKAHVNNLLEKADQLKALSKEELREELKSDLVEISLQFQNVPKDEQEALRKNIVDLLQGRNIILLQNNSSELFRLSTKVKLEEAKVNQEKEKLAENLKAQEKQIQTIFETHPQFCKNLGFSTRDAISNASVEELLSTKAEFLKFASMEKLSGGTPLVGKDEFFKKFDNLISLQIQTESAKIEIKTLDEKLFGLKDRLREIELTYKAKATILSSKSKVFNSIQKSIGGANDFFVSVAKKYQEELIKRTEKSNEFETRYAEQTKQLTETRQKATEDFVNNFIRGNPPGVKVESFNEQGPVLSVGEGKQKIQYNVKENNFSVVGLEDYNEDYLKFPAEPESLPKLQIVASFKEANYFASDASISREARKFGNWEMKDFFNNYLGLFASDRLQRPDELDGWKNLMLEARRRGHGLGIIMENLGVLNKHKALQGDQGDFARPQLNALLEAARVGNQKYLDRFFNRDNFFKNNYLKTNQVPSVPQKDTAIA